jgi:hypothetical protein
LATGFTNQGSFSAGELTINGDVEIGGTGRTFADLIQGTTPSAHLTLTDNALFSRDDYGLPIVLDSVTVTHQGTTTITGTGPFLALDIHPSAQFENQGTITVDDYFFLSIPGGGRFDNTGGLIETVNGYLNFQDSFVNGGDIHVNYGSGYVDFAGTFVNNGNMIVQSYLYGPNSGYDGAFIQESGLTRMDGGTMLVAEVLLHGGEFSGTGEVYSTINQDGGVLSPGNSPGILHIVGSYLQETEGTLELEIAGLDLGTEYDQLEVTGDVSLQGTIDISLLDGFVPQLGDQFNVISFGAFFDDTGATYANTDMGGFLELRPYLFGEFGGHLALRARPQQDGDINLDGTVDIFDVGEVSDYWMTAGPQGDVNGDGSVDIFDVGMISDHWMQSIGGGSPTQVPEPSTLVQAAMGAMLLISRLRRGR